MVIFIRFSQLIPISFSDEGAELMEEKIPQCGST